MKFTLDYKEVYKGYRISQLFDRYAVEINADEEITDKIYNRLIEIEDAHIKRTSKIRRIRRVLQRHGFELQVRNSGYGMKKNS